MTGQDTYADDAPKPFPVRNTLLGVGGALALIGIWYGLHHKPADATKGVNQAPLVTVAIPGKTQITGTISVTGSIAARHDMPVGSVGEGGTIQSVLVNAGQWVKRGQLLAVIDRSVQLQQLANQQANVRVAQADARLAQANLDRALKLVGGGFISNADVDRLTATRDAANARVAVAQALLGETRAKIRRLDIVAPADGLLLDRSVEPGQIVGPSSGALFRVAEAGQMELKAKLSETDLAQLHVGQKVKVTPVGSATSYTGEIWQVSPIIDPASRQGMARISLAYAPDLRPGGFASAEIQSGMISAPLLPESALQADAQGSYVYIVGPGNKAQRRRVKLAMVTGKGVAIASGLSGNERVVLRAGAFLSEGETVDPRIERGQ
ncbi:efflux RND transporter periplasmic adaptor subunit [Novosphingobium ovatum]|nr:efflux RND transporter periplasmic adaptor subunit [Novosphingobium ovatum]